MNGEDTAFHTIKETKESQSLFSLLAVSCFPLHDGDFLGG